MKRTRFIPALLLSAALLTGLSGCSRNSDPISDAATTSEAITTEAETEEPVTVPETTTEEVTTEPETTTEEATTEEVTTEPETEKEMIINDIWYVCTDQLNVRDLPSTEGNIVGKLYRGEEVRILEFANDGWIRMRSASSEGYVKSDFLTSSAKKASGSPDAAEANSAQTGSSSSSGTASNGYIVCIDPGHQQTGISEKEPNGPGSTVMKAKLTSGTSGVSTGLTEYQLNLDVSLMLQQELINRGYQVIMVRTTNDCPMSNAERALFANSSGADIFVRVHANSSENPDVNGAMIYAPSYNNPYLSQNVIAASNTLSEIMLTSFCATTGLANKGLLQDDTMTGINWCTIPVTIIEMGFMSNPTEDQKMADPAFQALMAQGMANGIDAYFGR